MTDNFVNWCCMKMMMFEKNDAVTVNVDFENFGIIQ